MRPINGRKLEEFRIQLQLNEAAFAKKFLNLGRTKYRTAIAPH